MSHKLDLIWRRFRQVKCDCSGAILLLHIGKSYYALFEDSLPVSWMSGGRLQRLHDTSSLLYCELPAGSLDEVVAGLRAEGYDVVVMEEPMGSSAAGNQRPGCCFGVRPADELLPDEDLRNLSFRE